MKGLFYFKNCCFSLCDSSRERVAALNISTISQKRRYSLYAPLVGAIVACGLFLMGCPVSGGGGATGYPYVCDNGTLITGTTDRPNVQNCSACESTYRLIGGNCTTRTEYTCTGGTPRIGNPPGNDNVEECTRCDIAGVDPSPMGFCATEFRYVCDNGTIESGMTNMPNVQNCSACNIGYKREAAGAQMVCNPTEYTCANGTPRAGRTGTNSDAAECTSCNANFYINNISCVPFGTATRVGNQNQFGVGESIPTGLAALGTTLYMVGDWYNQLYTLDTTTGRATAVGSATAFDVTEDTPTGLAAIQATNTLYMVGATNDRLYTLDRSTGVATAFGGADGTVDDFGVMEGTPIGLAAIGATLYMVGDDRERLYTLNITLNDGSPDGMAYQVGSMGNGFGVSELIPDGLTALGGILYMVGWDNDILYTLDRATGGATAVGSATQFGVREDNPSGLAAIGTTLYMVGFETDALYVLIR